MNRLFEWMTRSSGEKAALEGEELEQKQGGGLIAFHAAAHASWSILEGEGYAQKGFARNPVVYRCVRMISEAAASLPLKLSVDRVDLDEHQVLDLLKYPNARQSGARFFETIYGHLLISGNAYINRLMVEDDVREMHALNPAHVSPVIDENGWPVAYDYNAGSRTTRYSATEPNVEILHLSLFNPSNEFEGLSPLASAHMALDIHTATSSWNKALLDNSARPSGALVYASSAGDNLSDEQFDRLKHELEEGYAGASRAGRPMLLEGGLDWKAMGFSPRDMDFMQAKNGAAREIALAFGVPPMLLGIPGDNTYSNYHEANRAFWTQTVIPLAEKTVHDIGNWVSSLCGDGGCVKVNTENIQVMAKEREAHWNRIGSASFLTVDEKREALGYPALGEEEINDAGL